ncbi:hypothetical protein [Burkholderia cepacia]|uniref:hypothetical protein n=1 Tax=Burkholderia cepacia TaxID=292 RepID=UPI003D67010D
MKKPESGNPEMPTVSEKQHREIDAAASACPRCGGARIWKHAKHDGSAWRQYCSKCHCATSYRARNRRRLEYNAQIAARRKSDPLFKAYEIWKSAKDRASRKGIEFTLSREKVERAVVGGICEVTGIKFDMSVKNKNQSSFSPSVDKIDPRKGYTDENCQIVCWLYNRAKGDGTHAEVMLLVEALNARSQ